MRKFLLLSFMLMFAFAFSDSWAQERTVSGKVTSIEDGSTLPGVNVVLKGTTSGTVTDIDGNFKLAVPSEGGSLVFSFIGLATEEVAIGARSVIDIQMSPDVKQLSEVIVTAIGVEREAKALGYSVQQIESEEITKSRENNVVQALSGKVAGVQVTQSSGAAGAASYIKIRGNASLTGGNQPLFILDGVPINNESFQTEGSTGGVAQGNRAGDINPNDVASITVLKGPAATALYGIRASNGAVVITTKRGKKGAGTQVEFVSTYTVDEVTALPPRQMKYGQGSGGNYNGPETNDRHSWGPDVSTLVYDPTTEGTYLWDPRGQIIVDPNDGIVRPSIDIYNPEDQFYQKGNTLTTNLAVTGSNDKSTYRISIGRTDQKSVIPETFYERTSIRLNTSTELHKKITTSASFAYVRTDRQAAQQGSNVGGVNLGLYRSPITFDNTKYVFGNGEQRSYRGFGGTTADGTRPAIYDNPFWVVNKTPYTEQVDRMTGIAQVNYNPLDWLSITYRASTDFYNDRRLQAYEKGSANYPEGAALNDDFFVQELNSDFIVNVTKDFGDFNLNANFGQNLYSYHFENLYTEAVSLSALDFVHLSAASNVTAFDTERRRRLAAVYADIGISWQETVFLSFQGRNEWSSTLPKDNNSFFYPAVSLGYVFTETLGLGSNPIFSFGKIRASYASVGNDAPIYATQTPYVRTSVFSPSNGGGSVQFPFDGLGAFKESGQLGNTKIVPEENTTIELGADLRFFNGRLTIDATYYQQKSTDQILGVPIAASTGYTSTVLNAGEVENKGVELTIGATPLKLANGFTWDATINWSKNKNEVIKLAPGVDEIGLSGFTSITSSAVVGYAYGTFFGTDWERDAAGNTLIEDNPNSSQYGYPIVNQTFQPIGDPNPDWIAGIRNTFSYKGLALSFLFDIRQGGDIWNGTRGALTTMGTDASTIVRGTYTTFDGVLASSGETNNISVPLSETWFRGNGGGFGNQAKQFVEEASWVRLRDISLSYSLPTTIVSKTPFNQVDITLTGRNLWLKTTYSGIDPETNLTGNTNGFGFEYFNMPNTKSYGVNLRLTL